MLELLDFLKYGAVGVALALAGLSYRLLSREQDKTEIRPPILNTIRLYFLFSLFLSFFFGGVEIFSTFQKESVHYSEMDDLYAMVNTNPAEDSTCFLKKRAIESHIENLNDANLKYAKIIDSVNNESKLFDFYRNISDLSRQVNMYDGINLTFESQRKSVVFKTLNKIFVKLELCNQSDLSDSELIKQWEQIKSTWSNSSLHWIHQSDIGTVVRYYLRLQNNKNKSNEKNTHSDGTKKS